MLHLAWFKPGLAIKPPVASATVGVPLLQRQEQLPPEKRSWAEILRGLKSQDVASKTAAKLNVVSPSRESLKFKCYLGRLMPMKSIRTFVFLLGATSIGLLAQDKGTYSFLRNEVGARASGLNGSFVSITNDPNVLFYNPGALPTLTGPKGSVGFLKHLLDVNGGYLSYARSLEAIGTVGGGIIYLDYGSFTQTDESMNILGTFGARDLAIVIGVGRSIDEVTSVGLNLKVIYSSIADFKSSGLALDAGVLYQIPSENITIGASVLTLGTQLKSYDGTKESLPLDVKIGITKRPEHLPVLLNLNFHRLVDSQNKFLDHLSAFSLGAEFLMSESVRLRVGYNNQQRKELKLGTSAGLAGISLGGGIVIGEYVVDYSFNSYGKIGNLHRISIGMSL